MIPAILSRLRLPVIAAPMFIISTPELVVAECKAGIVGAMPAVNARPQAALAEWLDRIDDALAAHRAAHPDAVIGPYAINQIVHESNPRLAADVKICLDRKVPIFITSLRAPVREIIDAVHAYGGIVLHDVINSRHARKAIEAGVDGIILVAAGAGGHAGAISPFALVAEVRRFYDGLLILGGAISSGQAILATRALGADLAYIGTRFIATQESPAAPDYKDAILSASASDIVYSSHFTGVHGNYLRSSIARSGLDPDTLGAGDKSQLSKLQGADGPKAWRDIWSAGHGAGAIHDVPSVAELVVRLETEYRAARRRVADHTG